MLDPEAPIRPFRAPYRLRRPEGPGGRPPLDLTHTPIAGIHLCRSSAKMPCYRPLTHQTADTFLTTEEVIEYLQVNSRTVYRLIKARKIPAVRVGRQWRFRKRDVDAWLDAQRPQASMPIPISPATRKRVLVVDDEETIRDLLSRTLALADYQVDAVADASAALLRIRSDRYDLLVSDLRMPGIDGLTLIQQVRAAGAGIPVIIITGFSSEQSAIEAVNLGVTGYLTKPLRVPQVLAAAAKALGA